MTDPIVGDAEELYRSIRAGSEAYTTVDGKPVFSRSAFNDPERRPSVDRSLLCLDPRNARLNEADGVASLETRAVRGLSPLRAGPPAALIGYQVDVIHRPVTRAPPIEPRDNPAHCQVECTPDPTKTHFDKVKEALARLATMRGWAVPPGGGVRVVPEPVRPAPMAFVGERKPLSRWRAIIDALLARWRWRA